jgi:NAD(P)-dependent dehydrogenase (short-subunit alcohol dehydrogenase family)
MTENTKKVVLITGASSGIGQAIAHHLHQKGYQVYGTSRKAPARPSKISQSKGATDFPMLCMDIDSDRSVRQGVEYILKKEGRIDVVVNNAGWGFAGSIEDTRPDEAQALFETNLWGVLRICREILPGMRKQRSGYIVNISSIGGHIAVPFQGIYSAAKFALEGLTEALSMEVRPFGIHVVLIAPGDCKTQFTANRCRTAGSQQNQAYTERCNTAVEVMEHDEMQGMSPHKVARLLERIIRTPHPRLRYKVGAVSQKLAVALKKILPGRLFERLIMMYYKIA